MTCNIPCTNTVGQVGNTQITIDNFDLLKLSNSISVNKDYLFVYLRKSLHCKTSSVFMMPTVTCSICLSVNICFFSEIQAELTNLPILPNFGPISLILPT